MVGSSSNSTSRSITIILLSLVVEALLKYQYHFLYQPLFLSFSCFLLFYINIPHHCFIRDHNRNKVTQLFRVILPSHVMPNFSTTIFNFNEFIFVYVVNIRFICDGKLYKIYLSYKSCTCAINTMNTLTVQAFTLTQHEIIKTISRIIYTKPLQSDRGLLKALGASNYCVITKWPNLAPSCLHLFDSSYLSPNQSNDESFILTLPPLSKIGFTIF